MRMPPTILLAAALAMLGVSACGGGGSSPAATETAQSGSTGKPGKSGTGAAPSAPGAGGRESGSGSGGGSSNGHAGKPGGGGNTGSGGGSAHFTPKHHNDSGGGSAQFEVKGGDNSIQEFGSEAGGSEFAAAAAALHDFLDARSQGDWAAACRYLSKSVAESLELLATRAKQPGDTSCAGALSTLTNPEAMAVLRAEAARADVGSVRVEGERGFAIYAVGETVYGIPMTKEGGGWKVAAISGVPLS